MYRHQSVYLAICCSCTLCMVANFTALPPFIAYNFSKSSKEVQNTALTFHERFFEDSLLYQAISSYS